MTKRNNSKFGQPGTPGHRKSSEKEFTYNILVPEFVMFALIMASAFATLVSLFS